MNQFEQIADNKVQFVVDRYIYDDKVISKVLYWMLDFFIIERTSINEKSENIILEKKNGAINTFDFVELKKKIAQDFIDYKMRDIVNVETQNIRDILYVKAFSNNDDFEDYNLIGE